MDKIKILNVVTVVEDGGLEMLIYKLYKGLNKDIFDADLCILTSSEKESFILNDFRDLGCKVYNLNLRNKNIRFIDFFKNLKEIVKLNKLIRSGKYKIVHSHDFFPSFFTRITIIPNKIIFSKYPQKVFITYHNTYYWLKKPHRLINKLLSYFTDKIVCVSDTARIDSLLTEKISQDKYKVIHNGLDPLEYFKDDNSNKLFRKKYGYNENDFIIGNVGVLSVRKGQIYLLKAFNEIYHKYPYLKLLITGSTRPHEMDIYVEIMSYIKINKLEDKVKIIEPIKEVNGIYNIIDLFVMCSITEGFGLSAFEYMLTEKRCIFSDIDVFKELTKNGVYGCLFENKNYLSLSSKLQEEIEDFQSKKTTFHIYRSFVKEHYNLNLMVKEYEKLYKE